MKTYTAYDRTGKEIKSFSQMRAAIQEQLFQIDNYITIVNNKTGEYFGVTRGQSGIENATLLPCDQHQINNIHKAWTLANK
jgi:hypothetical protein